MLETWATVELKHDDHLMIMIHDDLPIVSWQTAWNDQLWRKFQTIQTGLQKNTPQLTSLDLMSHQIIQLFSRGSYGCLTYLPTASILAHAGAAWCSNTEIGPISHHSLSVTLREPRDVALLKNLH